MLRRKGYAPVLRIAKLLLDGQGAVVDGEVEDDSAAFSST
jgi:hypothetical protein